MPLPNANAVAAGLPTGDIREVRREARDAKGDGRAGRFFPKLRLRRDIAPDRTLPAHDQVMGDLHRTIP
jgi:hypothetical protein